MTVEEVINDKLCAAVDREGNDFAVGTPMNVVGAVFEIIAFGKVVDGMPHAVVFLKQREGQAHRLAGGRGIVVKTQAIVGIGRGQLKQYRPSFPELGGT